MPPDIIIINVLNFQFKTFQQNALNISRFFCLFFHDDDDDEKILAHVTIIVTSKSGKDYL